MYTEVELTSGEVVKVYPAPHFLIMAALETVSMPDPPMTMVKTLAGEEPWPDTSAESPAYQKYLMDKREAERKRNDVANETTLALCLKDVEPPADDDWYAMADYRSLPHRQGKIGRKLDYLYFYLLSGKDIEMVLRAYNAIAMPSEERISAKMNTFQGDAGRPAAQGHPGENGAGQSERDSVQPAAGGVSTGKVAGGN